MTQHALSYAIDDALFEQFPGYIRGVVLAFDVENGDSPGELVSLLRDAEASVRGKLNIDTLRENDRIASWRRAYTAFGAKPSKFRPSMEAMARRVLKDQELPAINRLVDIGNIASLRHLVPAGGHAIDGVRQDITLKFATGEETFVPFGSDVTEHPLPGEVIFTEGNTVLTRRWTWRQASHTILEPSTTAVEFNVDGLPPVPPKEVREICIEIGELIHRFCGGKIRTEILSKANPSIQLDDID